MYVMYIYVLKNQYYQNNYRPKEMIYNENFRVPVGDNKWFWPEDPKIVGDLSVQL